MERLIYFDHNSTTPYSSSVRKYLEQGILKDWYNPSSVYSQAQVLHQKIRECRKFVADYLNCSPKHLFFTSGATESINTILSPETLRLNQSPVVISSMLEHQASLKRIGFLSDYFNIHPILDNRQNDRVWHLISHNKQGEIYLDKLEETCSKHPHSLLSFLSANNETGVITDIQSISKIAKRYNCLVHVDAVQSLGKMPVDLEKWEVDFASFSGHKIGAMKGVGLLYAKKPFAPLMHGGGQERGLRPGTHNYPAIQSFKLAVQDIDLNKQEYVKQLRTYFENSLLNTRAEHLSSLSSKSSQKIEIHEMPSSFKVNCKKANRLSNTSNIYCGGISNQAVLLHLSQKGVCASAGSACNAGTPEPSHVLTAIADLKDLGNPKNYARSCIRISLAPSNTKQEVDYLIQSLKELYPGNFQSTESSINLF